MSNAAKGILLSAAVGACVWYAAYLILAPLIGSSGSPRSSSAPCEMTGPPAVLGTQSLPEESLTTPTRDEAAPTERDSGSDTRTGQALPPSDECTRCTPLFPLSERTDPLAKRVWAGLPLSVRSSADRLTGRLHTRFLYAADQILQDYHDANVRFWEQYGDEQVSREEFLRACAADQSHALMKAKLKDLLEELAHE